MKPSSCFAVKTAYVAPRLAHVSTHWSVLVLTGAVNLEAGCLLPPGPCSWPVKVFILFTKPAQRDPEDGKKNVLC